MYESLSNKVLSSDTPGNFHRFIKRHPMTLMEFYAPWCGHCNSMKDAYQQLGQELKSDEKIGIGAVDCDAEVNKSLCGRYQVQGGNQLMAAAAAQPGAVALSKEAFPRAFRALKGWKNLAPPQSRAPLPWALVAGMATALAVAIVCM